MIKEGDEGRIVRGIVRSLLLLSFVLSSTAVVFAEDPSSVNPLINKYKQLRQLEDKDSLSALYDKLSKQDRVNYRPRSMLSLVVDGRDPNHALSYLKKLSTLVNRKNVKIGSVLIIGESYADKKAKEQNLAKYLVDQRSKNTPSQRYERALKTNDLPLSKPLLYAGVLSQLEITSSPTWIVRHAGRDYIFEGFKNPETFFNKKGEFTDVGKR